MQPAASDRPTIQDASAREATGRSLGEWYTELDGLGGPARGRRELVQHLLTVARLEEWWATTLVVEYERARGQREKDGQPKGYSICSTKTVAAPLERVYAAFGTAGDLDRWLGAGSQVTFAAGGTLTNADGDRWTFTRLRPGKDLRFTWQHGERAPESQVEVLLADKGKGKTGITLNHTRIQQRSHADELRSGWSVALEALKRHLEGA